MIKESAIEYPIAPVIGYPLEIITRPYLEVYDMQCVGKRPFNLVGGSWKIKLKAKMLGAPPLSADAVFCSSTDDVSYFLGFDAAGDNFKVIIDKVERLIPVPASVHLTEWIELELAASDSANLTLVVNNNIMDTWEHLGHSFHVAKYFKTATASLHARLDYFAAEQTPNHQDNILFEFNQGAGNFVANSDLLNIARDYLYFTGIQDANWRWLNPYDVPLSNQPHVAPFLRVTKGNLAVVDDGGKLVMAKGQWIDACFKIERPVASGPAIMLAGEIAAGHSWDIALVDSKTFQYREKGVVLFAYTAPSPLIYGQWYTMRVEQHSGFLYVVQFNNLPVLAFNPDQSASFHVSHLGNNAANSSDDVYLIQNIGAKLNTSAGAELAFHCPVNDGSGTSIKDTNNTPRFTVTGGAWV